MQDSIPVLPAQERCLYIYRERKGIVVCVVVGMAGGHVQRSVRWDALRCACACNEGEWPYLAQASAETQAYPHVRKNFSMRSIVVWLPLAVARGDSSPICSMDSTVPPLPISTDPRAHPHTNTCTHKNARSRSLSLSLSRARSLSLSLCVCGGGGGCVGGGVNVCARVCISLCRCLCLSLSVCVSLSLSLSHTHTHTHTHTHATHVQLFVCRSRTHTAHVQSYVSRWHRAWRQTFVYSVYGNH